MKTSKALSSLVKSLQELENRTDVSDHVGNIVSLVIGNIEDDGLKITPEEFEKRLRAEAEDYFTIAKSQRRSPA